MATCIPVPDCFVTARELTLAQVLPAAGAFTSQGFTTLLNGVTGISFWVQYTRGAAGGFPALRIQWTNGTEVARDIVLDQNSLVVVQPTGTSNVYESELLGPAPADGNAITEVYEYSAPAGSTAVRFLAAERGVTLTPGTIAIALTTRGGC